MKTKHTTPSEGMDWRERFFTNFCRRETSPGGNSFLIVDEYQRNPEKYIAFIQSLLIEERELERQRILELEIMKYEKKVDFTKSKWIRQMDRNDSRNDLRKEIISLIKGRE
jgi:hypothetical protein